MGSNGSRPATNEESDIKPVRKQIGKRSSVNFLSRLDSRPNSGQRLNRNSLPLPTAESKEIDSSFTLQISDGHCSSDSISTIKSKDTTVIHHKREDSTIKTAVASENVDGTDDGQNFGEESTEDTICSEENKEATLVSNPVATISDPPLLPSLSILERESPSKYGLEEAMQSARNLEMPKAKRRTMSGPELFEVTRSP